MILATVLRPPAAPRRFGSGGRRGAATPAAAALLLASALLACAGAGRSSGEAAPGDAPPREGDTATVDALVDDDRRSPGDLLTAAVTAADSAGPAAALPLLGEVRDRCGASPAGARATILLAALHLDPRHADGEPQTAAEMAAEYLRAGVGPAWTGPVARALYLEALEKGASAPDPAGLGADPGAEAPGAPDAPLHPPGCLDPEVSATLASSRILPELPGTPMAERLEMLRARVDELEKELERIRDVLDEP